MTREHCAPRLTLFPCPGSQNTSSKWSCHWALLSEQAPGGLAYCWFPLGSFWVHFILSFKGGWHWLKWGWSQSAESPVQGVLCIPCCSYLLYHPWPNILTFPALVGWAVGWPPIKELGSCSSHVNAYLHGKPGSWLVYLSVRRFNPHKCLTWAPLSPQSMTKWNWQGLCRESADFPSLRLTAHLVQV